MHTLEGLITRNDIENIAETEQLILDDEVRISVLKAMYSIDVQACPGSGKTTLIATKLILLAKKWRYRDQGVCVLSHTNVAKDEIIERLKNSKTKEAQRLLKYPHFIGTIQEFVHRFLALPYIRSGNIKNIVVDNDEYAKQAAKLLELGQFGWLRGTLNGLGGSEALEGFLKGTFRYISQNGKEVNIDKKPRAWNQNEENLQRAKRDLDILKQYMDQKGCFLFRDMYTHAHEACTYNTELIGALRERFPCVLIDEMQDTQKFQDELLCKIFPFNERVIVQRFGDPDQSIFHGVGSEEPNQSFNEKYRDDMDFIIHKSHRFDGVLSDRIKCLSFNEIPLETELSEKSLAERARAHSTGGRFEHSIIVFNEDTQDRVVEAFAKIISNQFSTEFKKAKNFTVKVVGAVGKNIDPNAAQLRIGHYWSDFDKAKTKTSYKESYFIDAVRHCHRDSSIDWAGRYKHLITCILKLMRMSGKVDNNGLHFSASTLRELLTKNDHWERFRKGIFYLLNNSKSTENDIWSKVCKIFCSLLELENIPDEAVEYIAFIEEVAITDAEITEERQERISLRSLNDNKIAHTDGFHIELSTIHGVKGETHDATLIVETKNHTFDLKTMMPYLTGELPNIEHPNTELPDKPNSKRSFKPNKVFMRQLYVAMSRPKHLLCLALHSDRISDVQKELLLKYGWQIEIIEP
jgi:superfamily I DNA/RNA helicase